MAGEIKNILTEEDINFENKKNIDLLNEGNFLVYLDKYCEGSGRNINIGPSNFNDEASDELKERYIDFKRQESIADGIESLISSDPESKGYGNIICSILGNKNLKVKDNSYNYESVTDRIKEFSDLITETEGNLSEKMKPRFQAEIVTLNVATYTDPELLLQDFVIIIDKLNKEAEEAVKELTSIDSLVSKTKIDAMVNTIQSKDKHKTLDDCKKEALTTIKTDLAKIKTTAKNPDAKFVLDEMISTIDSAPGTIDEKIINISSGPDWVYVEKNKALYKKDITRLAQDKSESNKILNQEVSYNEIITNMRDKIRDLSITNPGEFKILSENVTDLIKNNNEVADLRTKANKIFGKNADEEKIKETVATKETSKKNLEIIKKVEDSWIRRITNKLDFGYRRALKAENKEPMMNIKSSAITASIEKLGNEIEIGRTITDGQYKTKVEEYEVAKQGFIGSIPQVNEISEMLSIALQSHTKDLIDDTATSEADLLERYREIKTLSNPEWIPLTNSKLEKDDLLKRIRVKAKSLFADKLVNKLEPKNIISTNTFHQTLKDYINVNESNLGDTKDEIEATLISVLNNLKTRTSPPLSHSAKILLDLFANKIQE